MAVTARQIETTLHAALAPAALHVEDESHHHAGHAGAGEGSHFRVQITSERFVSQSRIARHRLVYDALASLIPQGIHALAIEARTPQEVNAAAASSR
jgi:BolA protein